MADQWDEKARPIAQRINGGGKPPPAGSIKAGREAWLADVVAAELRSAYEQGKRDEREAWMDCAMYDALMEGPRFRGWNMSALSRVRQDREGPEVRGLQIDKDEAAALVAAIRSRSTNDACE